MAPLEMTVASAAAKLTSRHAAESVEATTTADAADVADTVQKQQARNIKKRTAFLNFDIASIESLYTTVYTSAYGTVDFTSQKFPYFTHVHSFPEAGHIISLHTPFFPC